MARAMDHRGVRSRFNRLGQRESSIEGKFLIFLAVATNSKHRPYGISPAIDAISPDDATSAVETAGRFIATSPKCS